MDPGWNQYLEFVTVPMWVWLTGVETQARLTAGEMQARLNGRDTQGKLTSGDIQAKLTDRDT